MDGIEHKFLEFCKLQTDINEHMPRLCELARRCEHVTEFGVGRSTWAFLHARPMVLRSYDLLSRSEADTNYRGTDLDLQDRLSKESGIDFQYEQADTLTLIIAQTDLLFIDTRHTYQQLYMELRRHSPTAGKYIVLHDTETFGNIGEDGSKPGLWAAVEEFVAARSEWRILERLENNNGLTVLRRG